MQSRRENKLDFLDEAENDYWDRISGWLLPEAAQELYKLARDTDPNCAAVEIGSYSGKSATCLGKALMDSPAHVAANRRLYAIDVEFQPDFEVNLNRLGVSPVVQKIQSPSLHVADRWVLPISFIYIDGNHGIGHAFADFTVWDMFLIPGGIMALDDTAGFNPGCVNAVMSAVSSGCYEKISDLGGITFLRKIKPSQSSINYFPMSLEAQISAVAHVSAWTGAFDDKMVIPVRQRGRQLLAGKEKADLMDTLQSMLGQILQYSRPQAHVKPTVNYLKAIIDFHSGLLDAAIQQLGRILQNQGSMENTFIHYDISIVDMVLIRLAQMNDIVEDREQAIKFYSRVAGKTQLPELVELARQGLSMPFVPPESASGILLREYIINSPLSRYRKY